MKRLRDVILLSFTVLIICCCGMKKESVQRKYMWFDCEANYERLSYPDSISFYLKKLREIGFTDVVVDVKSIMGETLFKSKYAPYMGEWKGHKRADDYDMLGIFISEAKKYDINVYASMNVFCGGHNFIERGIIYDEHKDWQSINYWTNGLRPISSMKWNYNGMLNPALPQVREYECNIIKEVVGNYKGLKGIILDRMRYDGITSDFSEYSRSAFEKYAAIKVENYPQDILYWDKDSKGKDVWKRGKHFNHWVEWRASLIYNFAQAVRNDIKAINPKIEFGDYTGAWYPVYYEVGVNWASRKYDPSKKYGWATSEYKNYGYADLLDLYMGGLYFNEVTIDEVHKMNEEAMKNRTEAAMGKGREDWYSVEGCADMANELLCGDAPLIGSIYVDQYNGNDEQFKKAVKMALKKSQGLMIFDIVHIIDRDWWDVLEDAVKEQ